MHLEFNLHTVFPLFNDHSIHTTPCIVRPANRDWACQSERCHTLSNKISLQLIGCNSLCTLYSCNQLKRRRQGWPTLYVSMPGKRLSLVCCWGPAAFHFSGWICCESFLACPERSCLEFSSTCTHCLCEKRKPWRVHAYMQARQSLRHTPM